MNISRCINGLIEGTQTLLSPVVDVCSQNILQMAYSDSRIGKIVGGMGLVWTACMLNNTGERCLAQTPSVTGWGLRLGAFTIGAYGAITVISGIAELIMPNNTHFIPGPCFVAVDEDSSCNREQLLEIHNSLLSCPEAYQAVNGTLEQGSFSIFCAPPEKVPTITVVDYASRKILIAPELADGVIVPWVLFQMNFLRHTGPLEALKQMKCSLMKEAYVWEQQRLYYHIIQETNSILEDCCVKRALWPEEWNLFKNQFSRGGEWRTFRAYFDDVEYLGRHAVIRETWDKSCSRQKRPKAEDEIPTLISNFRVLSLSNENTSNI